MYMGKIMKRLSTLVICSLIGLTTLSVEAKYDIKVIESEVNQQYERLKSSNGAIRLSAVKRLSQIPHKKAVEPLSYALNDPNIFIRKVACRALARLNYDEAVKPLSRRLKIEKDIFVQKEIIMALGELGDETTRWTLKKYQNHSSLSIKKAANEALNKLNKKN